MYAIRSYYVSTVGITTSETSALSDLYTVTVAQIGPILPYLLLVLILIFRPTGLLGKREV